MSANLVVLAGPLVSKPDMHVSRNGTTFAKMSLVVTRVWKTGSESKTIPFVAFGAVAEEAEKLRRGTCVLVQGRIDTKDMEGRNGPYQIVNIIADTIEKIEVQQEPQKPLLEAEAGVVENIDEPFPPLEDEAS